MYVGSCYMGTATKPQVIRGYAQQELADVEFDTVVGTGLSGALAAPVVALEFNADLLVIRKVNDSSHADRMEEGSLGRRWLFVDDFIETGATFRRVHAHVEEVASKYKRPMEFAGAFLYDVEGGSRGFTDPNDVFSRTKMGKLVTA
ncbi:hypothetical protein GS498_20965 [Rhodococcus hoagii]|nr:hypothetical protein [Prescottella equi]